MHKKGTGDDKQGKDAGNRTFCPYRNFSQAINSNYNIPGACLLNRSPVPGMDLKKQWIRLVTSHAGNLS